MMHLQLIPLKTPDGQIHGHARVQDGFVHVHAQNDSAPHVLLLTDDGFVSGERKTRLRSGQAVQAIALHTRGELQCCGFARNSRYRVEDIRARLAAMYQSQKDPAQAADTAASLPPSTERASRRSPPTGPVRMTPTRPTVTEQETACTVPTQPDAAPGTSMTQPTVAEQETACAVHPRQATPTEPVRITPTGPTVAEQETACAVPPQPDAAPGMSMTQRARDSARSAAQQGTAARRIPAEPLLIDEKGCVVDAMPVNDARQTRCAACRMKSDQQPAAQQAQRVEAQAQEASAPTAPVYAVQQQRVEAQARETSAPTADAQEVQSLLRRLENSAAAAYIPAGQADAAYAPESAEDSAMRAESFAALLARCDAVFRKIDAANDPTAIPPSSAPATMAQDATVQSRVPAINPFPHIFPGAQFFRESDNRGTEMLIGNWRRGDENFSVTAVRGEYSPRPPASLPGFTRYIRTQRGGFWVRMEQ